MRRVKVIFCAVLTKFLELLYGAKNVDHKNFILMFHDFGKNKTNPKEFYTNIDDFKNFILDLNSKRQIVSIEDAINGKGIALTFDDCFSSVFELVYPILKMYCIPFTIFITTEYVDKTPYITKQQLEVFTTDPLCTIGAHTLTHVGLRTSNNSLEEISCCKSVLERMINRPVDLFAYPYGSVMMCSVKNIRSVKVSGYKYAFSTIRGSINSSFRMRFFLPRVNGDHLVIEYKEKAI